MNALAQAFHAIVSAMQSNMQLVFEILGVFWVIHFVNFLLGYGLNRLGIYPRHVFGLPGILLSPFLHGDFTHLIFNSLPLFLLLHLMLIFDPYSFFQTTFYIILLSGGLIWLFGRRAIHVGASSLIMGYFGYLLIAVYNTQTIYAWALGAITLYYCGGLFLQLFPSSAKVSWEGHVFGFLAGVAVALW